MGNKISTYRTYLGVAAKSGTTAPTAFTKLCDISSFPDVGGDPQTIEVTTLSDSMQKYIPGIKNNDMMAFEGYYDHDTYQTIQTDKDTEKWYGIFFGGTGNDDGVTGAGADGAFIFTGYASAKIGGAGTNAGVPMTVNVVPTSVIQDATGTATIASMS